MIWGQCRWGTERWGASGIVSVPGLEATQKDMRARPYWEKHLYETSGLLLPTEDPEGTPEAIDFSPASQYWTLTVRDGAGEVLSTVTDWWGGTLELHVDEASLLTFRVGASDAAIGYFGVATWLWLTDRYGFVVDTFRLGRSRWLRSGDAAYLEVEAESRIGTLGREYLGWYSTGVVDGTPVSSTVSEIVAALLDAQEGESPITVGVIDDTIGNFSVPFSTEAVSILSALRSLQGLLPSDDAGHFYVTSGGALEWRTNIGPDGETIALGTRLQSLEYELDYGGIATRLYLYGESEDGGRLRLSDLDGVTVDYVEAHTDVYGVRTVYRVDKRIHYLETLLARANRLIEEMSVPVVSVRVSALDLAKADTAGYALRDLYPGCTYQVVDAPLGVDVGITLSKLTIDMDHPLQTRAELASSSATLQELLYGDGDQTTLAVDGGGYPQIFRDTIPEDAVLRNGDLMYDDGRMRYYDDESWPYINRWEAYGGA